MEKRVAIVGAGLSGLLACKYTASKGFNPIVFEAQDQVGGLWNKTIETTRLQNAKEFFQFSDFPWSSSSLEEMQSWEMWGGAGKAFGSKGKWSLKVVDTKDDSIKIHWFSDITGLFRDSLSDVFSGKVLHSMDYAAMDNASAAQLIKGKKIAVIGNDNPCTVIQRTVHWMLPDPHPWGVGFGFLCFSRFSELLVHKPGEGFFSSVVATMLSPLMETSVEKVRFDSKESFVQEASSCQIFFLPENFFDKVEDGSIVFRKSQQFSFCKEGLILDGEDNPLKADIVILATGYKGDEKLKNIFASPTFQNWIAGSPTSVIPLYRQMIHPRIPQVAVIGYSESLSNLYTFEMRCKWLALFLDEAFQLPSIKEMEKDIKTWEKYMKKYSGNGYYGGLIIISLQEKYYNWQRAEIQLQSIFNLEFCCGDLYQCF
ncbi:hypothetical protein DH2020_014308 [Rehmannia glutinosa]|uniref:Flavin-containing monooxygenase n=1 Tax=Rehmannia glutinosa TaxID=99300 RepID=A0ABR0WVZ0_REHGL